MTARHKLLLCFFLLAICPPFLYCKLFCRQDGGIATPPIAAHQPFQNRTIPRKSPTPLPLNERSVCFALSLASHHVLASLVKGRWLDGKAQALTLLHLLAICPLFLYCILFCRQDEGIVTPPSLAPHQPFPKPHYPTNFS